MLTLSAPGWAHKVIELPFFSGPFLPIDGLKEAKEQLFMQCWETSYERGWKVLLGDLGSFLSGKEDEWVDASSLFHHGTSFPSVAGLRI